MSDTPPASILVLADRADRFFGAPEILAELLALEGINDVEPAPLESCDEQLLQGRSLVIVGPADPSPRVVELLLAHAEAGGGLICLAPGEAFAARLGLKPLMKGLRHPRVQLELAGFPEAGLPVRGWAQFYEGEGQVLGRLLDREGKPAGFPALLLREHGRGKIAVLAWDLGASIYLLRQGDPLLAGGRSSGFARMRPSDLFEGWQDAVDQGQPVADLHCHLLRELVHQVWPADSVLPWLWYFPAGARTMMLFSSDDDWSTREQFECLIESCRRHEARLTFYLVQKSVVDRAWMEELLGQGFDFSIHPDLPPPTGARWEERLAAHVREFRDRYGRGPGLSVRNHAIAWWGYVQGARLEAAQGFVCDNNCFSLLPQGRHYMAGAGLPLHFSDLNGQVLPVLQLPTQFSDETTLGGQGFPFSLNLTPEQGIELVMGLLRQNAAGAHSLLCANAHPVSFATYSAPLWEPVMEEARKEGILVWSVDQFCRFWQARRQVRLRPIPKGDGRLRLPRADFPGLEVMVPVEAVPSGAPERVVGVRSFRVFSLED
ncbi:MAG: hypothetical protein FJY95_07215 [Candidatus Handelsmanbacteria bacterium]|nr:hypothetical protein [Candidatus Handelsmanbacteria bacterium]